jgi:subfamily B ATP-binding cassette protein MsbA
MKPDRDPSISRHHSSFALIGFYRILRSHAGLRLPVLVLFMSLGGFTEGAGVGLFVPLFSIGSVAEGQEHVITRIVERLLSIFGSDPTLNALLVLMLIVFLLKGFVSLGQSLVNAHIMSTLTYDFRRKLVGLLERTTYENFLRLNTGFLTNTITTESQRLVACFGHYTNTLVALIYSAAYGTLAFVVDPRGASVVALLGIALAGMIGVIHRISRKYSIMTSTANASLQGLLIETLQAFKYLRATNSFTVLSAKVDRQIRGLADYTFKLSLVTGILKSVGEPLGVFILVAMIYVNVSVAGQPLADFLVLALVFFRLVAKLMAVQTSWQKFSSTVGALEAVEKASQQIGRDLEVDGPNNLETFSERIQFRNVGFSYGDREILRDLNIDIRKNSTVAIVGKTGAGKTTVVNLLLGLVRPSSGQILVDGLDYSTLELASLRKLFGYVTQEDVIFSDTIAANVSLWACDDPDRECLNKVENAVRDVHAEDFVLATESGLQTMIGDRGTTLSGGQRQQLQMARELFQDPQILVMDEATSSLDAKSDRSVQDSLKEWKGRRTTVIVTHRLSCVRECDYIYVIDDGRVVEHGTFTDLYAQSESKFAELARLQGL